MAPAGSYEALQAAVQAGADAVYFGVGQLNMRSKSAANFTPDDLERIVGIARAAGVKSYLTVNTVIYEDELRQMHALVDRARAAGVDAVIASDLSAILYARRIGMEVHISTQCNLTNSEAVKFFSQWADVVVLARELSLDQIGRIARAIDEQQICGPSGAHRDVRPRRAVHGRFGQVLPVAARDGVFGQPGRLPPDLPPQIYAHRRGDGRAARRRGAIPPFAQRPLHDRLPRPLRRRRRARAQNRRAEYVKRVVACYDRALRAMETGEYTPELAAALKEELATVFNRGFWQGYYAGAPMAEHSEHYGSSATRRKVYVGRVTNFFKKQSVAEVWVEASPVRRGDELFFQGPTTGVVELTADPYVGNAPAQEAVQGVFCSLKTPSLVRRGDQLYRMVPADASNSQPD